MNIIAIVGPTAVGKTSVSIKLAKEYGGEILSADSMAVYKGMNIGTAKPTCKEQLQTKFYGIDLVDPNEPFSVGDYQKIAHEAIDKIIDSKAAAIVVGGSGLYVRAAIDGLSEAMPAQDSKLRKKLMQEAVDYGNDFLHSRLRDIDPQAADKIHPNNVKRVVRALEIYYLMDRRPSDVFLEDSKRAPRYPSTRFFGLHMDRDMLYKRIEARVDKMISDGIVDEVKNLVYNGMDASLTAMQGLGYKEIAAYLSGELSFDEAVYELKKNTRHFAKRQYTWFYADKRINWIDVTYLEEEQILDKIREQLLNDE